MKLKLSIPFVVAVLLSLAAVFGCAVPGPRYIDIGYTGSPAPLPVATIGISRFTDARTDRAKGELGTRTLNDQSKEIFLVRGMDLAATLTDTTCSFLEKKGMKVTRIPPWTPTIEGLGMASGKTDYLLTARIKTFGCKAEKKGALTEMRLEIDISFYLAAPDKNALSTIPVNITLTRKDINFTRAKLESFFNETLAEALAKALTFNQN